MASTCRGASYDTSEAHRKEPKSGNEPSDFDDSKLAEMAGGIEELHIIDLGSDSETDSGLANKIEDLETQIVYLKQEIEQLKTSCESQIKEYKAQVEQLEKELKEKDVDISKMQNRIGDLEKSVEEYKIDWSKLYLSQVAVEFEHAVCAHVLPEVFKKDKFATIRRLLQIINGGKGLPFVPKCCKKDEDRKKMLERAHERWEKLCDHVLKLPKEWKTEKGYKEFEIHEPSFPDMFRAIPLLKHERNSVAHPNPVSLKIAADILSDFRSDTDRKDFTDWQLDLIDSETGLIPCLRKMIEDSGIDTDKDKLKL